MRLSTRRHRLAVLASLVTLVAATVLTTVPAALAADPSTGQRELIGEAGPGRDIQGARPFRRVNVGDLPKASAVGPSSDRGAQRLDPSAAPSPDIGAFAAAPPVQAILTANPTPSESVAFPGLADASGSEPPDPWVAAGPEHVIQAVNTTFRISNRTGTTLDTVSMFEFFGLSQIPLYQAEVFDPRVIYDSLHGRWIAVETSFDCDESPGDGIAVGTGYIDIAISASADALGVWNVFSIAYPDAVPDYPGLGTSTDKVVVSANVFALAEGGGLFGCDVAGFLGTEMDVMAWSELIGNGFVNIEFLFSPVSFPNNYFTWRPALQAPATSATVHVVAQNRFTGAVVFARITGSPAGGGVTTLSAISDLSVGNVVLPFALPPEPKQPPMPPTIVDAVDQRPTDAVWQNNQLAFVSTYPCDPPTGIVVDRDCVRVTELSTVSPTPTRIQDFLISEEAKDLYMGGIGYAGNGDLHVVWTRSSETMGDFASSYAAVQLSKDAANQLSVRAPIAPGTGTYPGVRWGDYVGVAQDPQVPNAVWQANEHSAGASFWATEVSQLQTGGATYVPIAPLRVLDSRNTGIFTASTPKSFTVAGFSSSGGSIPPAAIAVTGNVTVVGQTAAGYVSVTTTATSTPRSSTLNFPIGDTRANNVTAPLAANGTLSAVYKAAAGKRTHILFDVTGYFLPGPEDAGYNTLAPVRVLDSRAGKGIGLTGRFRTGIPRQLAIAGVGDIPGNAVAITANLTVVGQTHKGFVSVTPTNTPNPTTSNLNFPTNDTRANGLTAKLSGTGSIWLVYKAAAGARTDLLLDVTGYYLALADGSGLKFFPLDPGRIMDTRTSVLSGLTGTFLHNASRALDTDGHWGVPALAKAVTGNLTVTGQTRAGYVAITPDPHPNPPTSTINFPLGDTRANGVTVPLSATPAGNMSLIYKASAGKRTHLILDVTGYFK